MFELWFGIPEIRDFWLNLTKRIQDGNASKDEVRFHKKLTKTLRLLQQNPHHNLWKPHEIDVLTKRYGMKVWESYIENRKPAAGRIFWVYYPKGSITIVGLERHPNNKKNSYDKITLSSTGE